MKINVEIEVEDKQIISCICQRADHLTPAIFVDPQTFRAMRKFRKKSIIELAGLTGLHRNTIGYIDRGEINEARFSTLSKIANALDCELHVSLIPYESENK